MNAGPLLAAIEAAVEAKQDLTERRHLGASLIGHECQRFLWYVFRWVDKERFEGRMLRLFERGQLEEARFVKLLQDVGATVYERDPATGKQWLITDVEGHFGGSTDGVGINIPQLPPDMPAVLEMKTHGEKSYALLRAKGLQEAKPTHYVQLQTYMLKLNIQTGLYMAVNKNTDELYFEFIALDPHCGQRAINRARSVIYSNEPPPRISTSPGWYVCRFCNFQAVCHLNKRPAINCRTCCHSTPVADGQWACAKNRLQIRDIPQLGCDEHLFNPYALNIAAITAGDTNAGWLTLTRKDGTQVTTGPSHVKSEDLTL